MGRFIYLSLARRHYQARNQHLQGIQDLKEHFRERLSHTPLFKAILTYSVSCIN